MGTIYGLIRYFNFKRFWAPLGAAAMLATATVAWAVAPTLVFELDGNVADDPGNTIADWNTLNGDCTVPGGGSGSAGDRKSTRLNSSHTVISYAVFCLKKKK